MTSALIHEAHALEDQARALLPPDVVAQALHARAPHPTATRGPDAESLRDAARTLSHGPALAILKRADTCYWAVAMKWRKFAAVLARRYRAQDAEVAQQWAMIGLYNAAMRFDPARDISFATYAKHHVRAVINAEMTDNENPVYVGFQCRMDVGVLRRLLVKHPEWNDGQILAITGWKAWRLNMARAADLHSSGARSISERLGKTGGFTLADVLVDHDAIGTDEAASTLEARRITMAVLRLLPEREAAVIRGRFGIDGPEMTTTEVGVIIGRSRQRVQQIEILAMNHARELLATNAHRQAA